MRFSLSYNSLLALQFFYTEIVIYWNCSFSKLFHPCSHVIEHWWWSLGRNALPTSKTISKIYGLTGVRDFESKLSLCPRVWSCDWSFNHNHNYNCNITWLEHLCPWQQQDKMILKSLGWRNNHKKVFKWKMNYLGTWWRHFGEVHISIWNMLSTRWSNNMILRTCM